MQKIHRRKWIQNNIAMMAGGAAAIGMSSIVPSSSMETSPNTAKEGVKLALALPHRDKDRWKLALQIGVSHAIVNVQGILRRIPRDQYADALAKVKEDFNSAGMTIAGVESHPVNAERIKLGSPGRDEDIENYKAAITAMGKTGIPMCCYNFMAGLGWYRTRVDVPERGGALTSEFEAQAAEKQGLTKWGAIPEATIWENLTYFLKRIIPVAEEAGVRMALHPDDPPISPLRGIGRILTSVENYRRVLDIVPSPMNGIAFCQANFKAMGEDIEKAAKEFCEQKKIFFVHFRDIEGQGQRFRETFHDNGPTNMPRMLQIYHDAGFTGPIRPDHAPTLIGESNDNPGYAVLGKVLAIGYMKGIMQALNIPCQ
ncbi:MAG: mannonate dehydratase [Candidatus Omnitrophota bacterium]